MEMEASNGRSAWLRMRGLYLGQVSVREEAMKKELRLGDGFRGRGKGEEIDASDMSKVGNL